MTATKTPVFDRLAAAVADFGSPFCAEERRRGIWNEASAFGLQRPSGGFVGRLFIGTAGAVGFLGGQSWLQRRRRQRAEAAESTHPGL